MTVSADLATISLLIAACEDQSSHDAIRRELRRHSRALKDMLEGRPISRWRLERTERFMSKVAKIAMQQASSPGCRVVRL
jgi:hypothetical protein